MTITCIDSSALLRAVFGEGDQTLIDRALVAGPTVASLACVEVPCGIEARVLRGEYPAASRPAARARANRLLAELTVVAVDEPVHRTAIKIAERHLLRTLDLIHLAAAVTVAQRLGEDDLEVRFCTADRRQAEVAAALLGPERVDFIPPWR